MMPASTSTPSVFFSKGDFAYHELKRLIIRGDLSAGSKLDLETLAHTLGVSRMPLREALMKLQTQGLVAIHPQRATEVAPLSINDMAETYDARRVLEGLMAERAAGKFAKADIEALRNEIRRQRSFSASGDVDGFLESDRAFHFQLFTVAGAPRIRELLERLRDVADRYIHLYLEDPKYQASSIRQHLEIVRLCESGDDTALVNAVEEHVTGGKKRLLQVLPTIIAGADATAD
jgi:DNA-binding GntR family transcriptional regulator